MKCPKCWTEKVHRHQRTDWRNPWLACLSIVPVKCHHCYYKFYASWFSLGGRSATQPLAARGKAGSP